MAWSAGERKGEVRRNMSSKVAELHPKEGTEAVEQGRFGGGKDLNGGMEMLELDFLLGVIEETKSGDSNDVTMRKLGFKEVLRRDKQNQIDSGALAVYVVNQGELYGKNIQCEAMKELTKRTQGKK